MKYIKIAFGIRAMFVYGTLCMASGFGLIFFGTPALFYLLSLSYLLFFICLVRSWIP